MSSDRPSDAMQPNAKRRAAGQGSKDDVDDEEEVVDPGSWKPVDPDEIAKRRKVRVRRTGGAEPEPAEGAQPVSANPFAGIAVAAPTAAAAAPASNPFAGFNLVPPTADQTPAASVPEQGKDAAAASAAPAAAGAADATEKAEDADKASKDAAGEAAKEPAAGSTTPASGFGFGFASGSNPFAALTSSSKSGGFGGFASFGSAQPSKLGDTPSATPTGFTPLFGGNASKPSGFSFGTSAFPSIGSTPKPAGGADDAEEGGEAEASVELFNDSTAEFRPVVTLPDQKTVTGEEEESVTFTADATLFEFEPASSKWRERGKGEFRLNKDKASQVRMLMRQAGNFRLLLNAKVYSGMAVQKMSGDVGVTFACANAASAVEPSTPTTDKKEGEAGGSAIPGDSTPKLATWCLKIKNKELVTRLFDQLTEHKSATPAPAP